MNYGSITASAKGWSITGEPFVRARLKRVFPRAPQHAAESIDIAATPENSRDLLWFTQRYPMDIAAEHAAKMEALAARHEQSEKLLADLLAGIIPPVHVELAEPARDYQAFAAQMFVEQRRLLLADDLGVGKTVSAIAGMLMASKYPVVVVCPAHLTPQWRKMLKRFVPRLTTHILKKGTLYDLKPKPRRGKAAPSGQGELALESGLPDVIITSYHMLRGWAEYLAGVAQLVVYDECQALRRPGTDIYRAATVLTQALGYSLGLSATPIYNYGVEFFHVLDAINPGRMGPYSEFVREWCTPGEGGKTKLADPKLFGSYLRREGIMLRRTRKDVGRELPKLTKIVHEVSADEKALEDMTGSAVGLARIILSHNEAYKGQRMQASGEFDALMRQATGIAKAPYVIEFVKMLLASGEKVVLFGWHRAVFSLWMEGLAAFKPVLYTGTESVNQKDASVEAFISGDSQVLLMSLRSGAGVDGLQAVCSIAVIGELDWSPGVIEQCCGRVDRDGQDTPCTAYYLVSEAGADPIMCDVLGVKREQIEGVRNPDMALAERIDTGENNLRRLAQQYLERHGGAVDLAVEDLAHA